MIQKVQWNIHLKLFSSPGMSCLILLTILWYQGSRPTRVLFFTTISSKPSSFSCSSSLQRLCNNKILNSIFCEEISADISFYLEKLVFPRYFKSWVVFYVFFKGDLAVKAGKSVDKNLYLGSCVSIYQSTAKWQRPARKKYSSALYLSSRLSRAL